MNLRTKAHSEVRLAVERGALAYLDGSVPCADCGAPATEYDHRDYAKPLEVDAVCHRCNTLRGKADNWVSKLNPSSKTVVFNIRLEVDVLEQIRVLAQRERRTMTNMVQVLITEAIEHREQMAIS